jgi:hypothetical protein
MIGEEGVPPFVFEALLMSPILLMSGKGGLHSVKGSQE